MTLGQRVFIPLADQRGDSKHRRGGEIGFIPSDNCEVDFGVEAALFSGCFQEQTQGRGHKNTAAHESQSVQPLTCLALSHAGCLRRSDDFKTAHYVRLLQQV